jgi:osmotically-inducible protein OsmY
MRKILIRTKLAAGLVALALLPGCAGLVVGAAATGGVAALQERGFAGTANDNAIALAINHHWFQRSEKMFAALQTQIYEGRVLISGAVTDPDMRAEAIQLAWKADGVREILNEIEVTSEGGLRAYAKDTWTANELRTRLLFARGVNSINYSVEVVNGTVYLLGVAADQAEHDRVLGIARNMANVRRVVSHVIARDDPRRTRPPPGEENRT